MLSQYFSNIVVGAIKLIHAFIQQIFLKSLYYDRYWLDAGLTTIPSEAWGEWRRRKAGDCSTEDSMLHNTRQGQGMEGIVE